MNRPKEKRSYQRTMKVVQWRFQYLASANLVCSKTITFARNCVCFIDFFSFTFLICNFVMWRVCSKRYLINWPERLWSGTLQGCLLFQNFMRIDRVAAIVTMPVSLLWGKKVQPLCDRRVRTRPKIVLRRGNKFALRAWANKEALIFRVPRIPSPWKVFILTALKAISLSLSS